MRTPPEKTTGMVQDGAGFHNGFSCSFRIAGTGIVRPRENRSFSLRSQRRHGRQNSPTIGLADAFRASGSGRFLMRDCGTVNLPKAMVVCWCHNRPVMTPAALRTGMMKQERCRRSVWDQHPTTQLQRRHCCQRRHVGFDTFPYRSGVNPVSNKSLAAYPNGYTRLFQRLN